MRRARIPRVSVVFVVVVLVGRDMCVLVSFLRNGAARVSHIVAGGSLCGCLVTSNAALDSGGSFDALFITVFV